MHVMIYTLQTESTEQRRLPKNGLTGGLDALQ